MFILKKYFGLNYEKEEQIFYINFYEMNRNNEKQ
jgi:hypothetical protein